MTLRSFEYLDPLRILEIRESGTCKGCEHLRTVTILNDKLNMCELGRNPIKRCGKYKEQDGE